MTELEEELIIRAYSIKDTEYKEVIQDIANKYGGRWVDFFIESYKKIKNNLEITN